MINWITGQVEGEKVGIRVTHLLFLACGPQMVLTQTATFFFSTTSSEKQTKHKLGFPHPIPGVRSHGPLPKVRGWAGALPRSRERARPCHWPIPRRPGCKDCNHVVCQRCAELWRWRGKLGVQAAFEIRAADAGDSTWWVLFSNFENFNAFFVNLLPT